MSATIDTIVEVVSAVLLLGAGALALIASAGILRFRTPFARFHAAGKASPVAFLLAAAGAGLRLGGAGASMLAVAAIAIVVTLPIGVHLLFRATNRSLDA